MRDLPWWLIVLLLVYGNVIVPYMHLTVPVYCGVLTLLLITRLSADPDDGLTRFLKSPASQYLGLISFSFYLLHSIPLELVNCGLWTLWPGYSRHYLLGGLVSGALVVLLTIPAAHVMYYCVELPSIRVGKTVASWIIGTAKLAELKLWARNQRPI